MANEQRIRLDERTESLDLTLKGLAPVIADSLAPVLRQQLEPSLELLSKSLANLAKQAQGTASETATAVASGIADTLRASYDEALQQMREILSELNTWSLANRDALGEELSRYRGILDRMQHFLDAADGAGLEEVFARAREARERWLKSS